MTSTSSNTNTKPEAKTKRQTINVELVLLKIWLSKNNFDQELYDLLVANKVDSLKKIQLLHSFDINDVQWNALNENTTKKMFAAAVKELESEPKAARFPVRIIYQVRSGVKKRGKKKGGGGMFMKSLRSKSVKKKKGKSLGFQTGGEQGIVTFRKNILTGRVPRLNSITYEGIFSDYYFDTESNQAGDEVEVEVAVADEAQDAQDVDDNKNADAELPLFYPSYCYAKSAVPQALSGVMESNAIPLPPQSNSDMVEADDDHKGSSAVSREDTEYFLTVGLNSNLNEDDFERKKLNLVIVLDISGSMGSPFDSSSSSSKMEVANQCCLAIASHLNSDDRFGMVIFDNNAYELQKCAYMKDITMNEFRRILMCKPCGGTNFEAGYKKAIELFDKNTSISKQPDMMYDNRIIYLTDACPNAGRTDPDSLLGMVSKYATRKKQKIYSTFVGVGLDFNSDLIQQISTVRGANYMAVSTNQEFIQKMDGEFDFMVSPMVFNLELVLQNEGSSGVPCIQAVYGSNEIDIASGQVMKINSLFPSPVNEEGETKGGIVLIKLKTQANKIKGAGNESAFVITCSYEDVDGQQFSNKQKVVLTSTHGNANMDADYYDNDGVRKGIVLARYVRLMKQWIQDRNSRSQQQVDMNKKYQEVFTQFKQHFVDEMNALGDKTMQQEVAILDQLLKMSK